MSEIASETRRTPGLLARLAMLYDKVFPETPQRPLISESLAAHQMTDLERLRLMAEQAAGANVVDLTSIAPSERVKITLIRHKYYGHARELTLERQPSLEGLDFTVTGDDKKEIYEKTDKTLKPFTDGTRITLEPPLASGEPFMFYLPDKDGIRQSDYSIYQATVAYQGRDIDLLVPPTRPVHADAE